MSNKPIDQVTRDFLLEQILSEQKQTNTRLSRVENLYVEVLAVAQSGLATAARVTKHARRIRMLERVVYEDAPRPDMSGPPEQRRPVIPPPQNEEDSGVWQMPPDAVATLKSLEQFREREQRRESFFYRKRWSFVWWGIGAVALLALTTCAGIVAPRIERALFSQPKATP